MGGGSVKIILPFSKTPSTVLCIALILSVIQIYKNLNTLFLKVQ
jgi:hypothetical protein